MAVYFYTKSAQQLLDAFDAKIAQKELKGKITTWTKSDDGKYYTHTAKDWNKKAWFLPAVKSDRLTFYIIKPQGTKVDTVIYAYYHGHLTETFLAHFDHDFTTAESTAQPVGDDNCG